MYRSTLHTIKDQIINMQLEIKTTTHLSNFEHTIGHMALSLQITASETTLQKPTGTRDR